MRQPQNGEIWRYNNSQEYLVSNVQVDSSTCSIMKPLSSKNFEEGLKSGSQIKVENASYDLSEFNRSAWVFVKSLTADAIRECPECNLPRVIRDGDFLCDDCRSESPNTYRLIAEGQNGPEIIVFSISPKEISVGGWTIRRNELPTNVVDEFQSFLN